MRTKSWLVAALSLILALPALAQAPQGGPPGGAPPGGPPQGTPQNVRGEIVKLDGQNLTVKTREGQTVMVALAPNTGVRALQRKQLSDIKDGDYLASSSVPGEDGKLHALEIHYLPPAAPELQIPYDLQQGSVMTNAHVSGTANVKGNTDIALTYKGTATTIVVDSKTVIVGPADAAMADLQPSKAVFIRATKAADGSLSANNVTVEKDGVKPPM